MKKSLPIGSSQYINKLNKIKILNLIRESSQISRADVSKKSGISAPTVTRIVESLIIEEGLVKEVGAGESSGGRRPTLVEFAGLDNFVIGIDLGATHIVGILSNLSAQTIAEIKIETKIEDGFDRIMDRTAELICELKKNPEVNGKKIFGVGVAVAGLINRWKKVIEISPDLDWENVDIVNVLSKKCNLPVIFDNVTRVMALGELMYGVGEKYKNFIVVNIGYGIGAGVIINGEPLFGPIGMAGEFGHLTMDKDSKIKCACGNYGCLEALASGHAIAMNALREIENGSNGKLFELYKKDKSLITAETVAEAARQGDPFAKKIFDEAVEYIGIGISNLINLISPEVVLIGGGVSQSSDLIFDRIDEIINERTIKTISRKVKIEPVTFGMNAASKGSIALILNTVLQFNHTVDLPEYHSQEKL